MPRTVLADPCARSTPHGTVSLPRLCCIPRRRLLAHARHLRQQDGASGAADVLWPCPMLERLSCACTFGTLGAYPCCGPPSSRAGLTFLQAAPATHPRLPRPLRLRRRLLRLCLPRRRRPRRAPAAAWSSTPAAVRRPSSSSTSTCSSRLPRTALRTPPSQGAACGRATRSRSCRWRSHGCTRDQPRSPECTQGHPRSSEMARDHATRSALVQLANVLLWFTLLVPELLFVYALPPFKALPPPPAASTRGACESWGAGGGLGQSRAISGDLGRSRGVGRACAAEPRESASRGLPGPAWPRAARALGGVAARPASVGGGSAGRDAFGAAE